MRRPALLAVVLAVLTLSAPVAAAVPGSVPVASTTDSTLDSTQDGAPADPATDVLGWENGYWYNESIDVNPADGLNDSELEKVVARSMARVEEVRGLEFERTVPVEIYTREQLQSEITQQSGNTSPDQRLHQNVKYEATFMVGESTDAVGVQQSNQGASVGGYYSPTQERIVVVSDNAESPQLDEITLSQELFHALQDQQFDIGSYNQTTREKHNAIDGIVEGDGNYVDYLYQQRCELPDDDPDAWGDCLADTPAAGSNATGGSPSLNLGLYLVVYQPYSDGPAFVRSIHESQGWEAVNAVYENPPASTEQTIHPDLYEQDAPTEVTIEDRSDDRWNVLELEGGVDYAEFGEGGLASMFIYPTYAAEGQGGLLAPQQFLNLNESNQVDSFDPLNYNQTWSNGWDGDKLLPYVTEESASTNETGYVWKMQWDSPQEAQEFRDGYERLLGFHGATQVGQDTYVVEEGPYADAFHITVDGNATTIVNAPTVEDLSGVDGSVEVQAVQNGSNATDSAAPETGGTENDSVGDAGTEPGDTGTSSGFGPGFGVVAALVALLAVALLARRS